MKILGIETSCDDTCASVLEKKGAKISLLSQIISSQEKLHAQYGGVFPSLAKREHQENIVHILEQSLKKANLLKPSKTKALKYAEKLAQILERNPELLEHLKPFLEKYEKPKINKIAVTVGPGLEPCLWVGVNLAKALAFYWGFRAIIGVNHLEGHLLSFNFNNSKKPKFPAIGLIVSGGNTQLVLIKKVGSYKLIGETRDDAAGECFDKTARILGLGYPGGKEISRMAKQFKKSEFNLHLPRPMIHEKNFDFSFSGLKTAVLYDFKKRSESEKKSIEYIAEMSKEVQNSIVETLNFKTMKAVEKYKAKSIILGGGVSANEMLRQTLTKECSNRKIECFLPENEFTADNASMIALAALISKQPKSYTWKNIKSSANLKIK
jgi:N6-L-threonylcarbamoyladenine synthase